MKSPKRKNGPTPTPEGSGGKALQRLKLFQAQRGLLPEKSQEFPTAPAKKPRRKSK